MSYTIRRLTPADAAAYRVIRLEALTNHPEAFASGAEEFALHAVDDLEAVLARLVFFGAELSDGSLGGIMAFDVSQGRQAHRGWLIQVYVRPDLRGTGCAQALLDAVIDYARGEVRQLHLGVASTNAPAIGLYTRAGFEIYGTDPRFMAVNGAYIDEHMMVRFLDEAPGKTDQ